MWKSVFLTAGLLTAAAVTTAFRLPRLAQPQHYDLTLFMTVDGDPCTFKGKVEITLDVLNDTDKLVFHSKGLDIDESSVELKVLRSEGWENSVNQAQEDLMEPMNVTLEYGRSDHQDFVTLRADEELAEGAQYKLSMEFNGTMTSWRSLGPYCRPFKDNGTTRWIASTTFEPNLARTAFPCWDEPNYKANFTLTIGHKENTIARSNMPLQETSPMYYDGEDWIVDTFETSPKMSTYLVSWAVGEFVSQKTYLKGPSKRELTAWGAPSKIQYSDFPLRLGPRHHSFFEKYFDIKDPMPKTDFIAIPHHFAGGIENWGIINFQERLLFLDNETRGQKRRVMSTNNLVAHELAHIWFGNLVTPSWWNQIWLSEGFANYYGSIATHRLKPEWDFDLLSASKALVTAFYTDGFPYTQPLLPPATALKNLKDVFNDIPYNKGFCIIRMLNYTFGEPVLKETVRRYLKANLYGSASQKSLWKELGDVLDEKNINTTVPINIIMSSWTSLPGYPVLTVVRDYEKGEVTISQKNILKSHNQKRGWWIPITYTHEGEKDFNNTQPKFWLSPKQEKYTFKDPAGPDEWLLFNIEAAGYYRIRYDLQNLELLMDDFETDFPIMNTFQVLSDVLELGFRYNSGVAPSSALKAVEKLNKEDSPYPWFSLFSMMPRMISLTMNTPVEKKFKSLLKQVLEKGLTAANIHDNHYSGLVKWSCELGSSTCNEMTSKMFRKWSQSTKYRVPEDLRSSVYCTGIKEGNETTWEYVLWRARKTLDRSDQKDMFRSLSCTQNTSYLSRRIKNFINNKNKNRGITTSSLATLMKAASRRNPTFFLGLLTDHATEISKMKKMRWRKMVQGVAPFINTDSDLQKLENLLRLKTSLVRSTPKNDKMVRLAASNIKWLEASKDDLSRWVESKKPHLSSL